MANFVTKLFVGALLLTSGALAARDVCQTNGTSHICSGSLNYPRHLMPQVEGVALSNFLNAMSREGFHIEQTFLDPSRFIPIQGEINGEIIEALEQREGYDPCRSEPILVNHNGTHFQVVDGHHRWAACRLQAERVKECVKQLAIVIYNTSMNILERLKTFPGVFRLNMNDIPIVIQESVLAASGSH